MPIAIQPDITLSSLSAGSVQTNLPVVTYLPIYLTTYLNNIKTDLVTFFPALVNTSNHSSLVISPSPSASALDNIKLKTLLQ